jgi:two-component system, OmpR family, sensor histidine kinase VicK
MELRAPGNDVGVRIGVRWWLALAFAVVAATTAIAVAKLSSDRSQAAFAERAQALAAGTTFQAAIDLRNVPRARLPAATEEIARQRGVSLFLFDENGRLITSSRSRGIQLDEVPEYREAVARALRGERYVATDGNVRATVVALFSGAGNGRAIVARASHPELARQLGIVHDQIYRSAWLAFLVGGIVGFGIATLIALRVRRITRAAAAIERGDLETPLRPRYADEVGELAETFDRMRERLRASFAQLARERDRLQEVLERLNDGVVAVNGKLEVEFANRTAQWVLGLSDERSQLPEPWADLSLRGFAESLFVDDRVREHRVRSESELEYSIIGVPAHGGQTVVLVIRDVTERERRERAEREFVANASHELRTPLTTILGAVEVLQNGAKDRPDDRDRFLAHIAREANRLMRLTRALLVLARAQTHEERPRLGPVAVKPLLDEIASATRAHPGVELVVECADDVWAHAERDLLEQAVVNLTANAAEHTTSGRIVLAANGKPDEPVRVEVRDSGPGIRPRDRERVFERFYRPDRSAPGGFGLGLAIVAAAVRAQEGSLEVGKAPEGGARMAIVLERGQEDE